MRRTHTLLGLAWLSVVALPLAAQATGEQASPVTAATVRGDTVRLEISGVGSLRAAESITIRPEIAGRVLSIEVEEGQAVEAGAVLVRLDDKEFRAQLEATRAEVRLAELTYGRAADLQDKKLASVQAYDEASARLAEAKAREQLDRVRLEKSVLRAPFDGVLGLRRVSPGAYLRPGDDVFRLEKLEPLKLDFRVPETHLARIRAGQAVTVEVDALPGERFTGELYAIDSSVDEATRTIGLRALVPNPEHRLRPGSFARVRLVLEERADAPVVSESAIVPRGDRRFVYRVQEGRAVMTPVRLGVRRAGDVEILEGVGIGDVVVTDGQLKLRDGAAVEVRSATLEP